MLKMVSDGKDSALGGCHIERVSHKKGAVIEGVSY